MTVNGKKGDRDVRGATLIHIDPGSAQIGGPRMLQGDRLAVVVCNEHTPRQSH